MSTVLTDGTYTIAVTMTGGSGRATIASPTKLTVSGGTMQAEITWSSPYYDYMKVADQEYAPIQTEGNSCFLIDVPALDCDISITAETLAMSEPHRIDYTLYFDASSVTPADSSSVLGWFLCGAGAVLVLAGITAYWIRRKRRTHAEA